MRGTQWAYARTNVDAVGLTPFRELRCTSLPPHQPPSRNRRDRGLLGGRGAAKKGRNPAHTRAQDRREREVNRCFPIPFHGHSIHQRPHGTVKIGRGAFRDLPFRFSPGAMRSDCNPGQYLCACVDVVQDTDKLRSFRRHRNNSSPLSAAGGSPESCISCGAGRYMPSTTHRYTSCLTCAAGYGSRGLGRGCFVCCRETSP
jgi:hypothetical protein